MNQFFQTELGRLHCNDCLSVMTGMATGSVDLTVTSPPYDCSISGSSMRTYKGYIFNFPKIARELYRITVPGGVLVWVVGDQIIDGSESGESFRQALYFMEIGFKLHDTMIYQKNGPTHPEFTRYHQIFEYMFVFSRGRPKTVHLLEDRLNKWPGSWGRTSFRNKDGSLDKREYKIPYRKYGIRFNIWPINTGYGFSTKDKITYEHPACVDEKTECLTLEGWKKVNEISLTDFVASLNLESRSLEWQKIRGVVIHQHCKEAISVEGRRISMLLNLTHRCIIKSCYSSRKIQIKRARDLKKTNMIPCNFNWSLNDKLNSIQIESASASLLGWFISDGNFQYWEGKREKRKKIIAFEISQSGSKINYVAQIENIFRELGIKFSVYHRKRKYRERIYSFYTFHSSDKRILKFLLKWTDRAHNIRLGILRWKREALYDFFIAFARGDGCFSRRDSIQIVQKKNRRNLDVLQAIGIRLGFEGYLSQKHSYIEFLLKTKCKLLRNSKNTLIRRIPYQGIMWCPVVEKNGTFIARRKGHTFVTGNSFPEALARDHIRSWSNPDDLVFDPMCGSGTVPKMAEKLKRRWVACDVSEEYCQIAIQRIQKIWGRLSLDLKNVVQEEEL